MTQGTVRPKKPIFLAVLVALLLGMGGLVWIGNASPVQASGIQAQEGTPTLLPTFAPTPTTPAEKPDNQECLVCHSAPNQVMTFPNGDTISVTVDDSQYDHAQHAYLDCKVCHSDIRRYPHPEVTAQTARDYSLEYEDSCSECHPGPAFQTMDNAHAQARAAGNPNTPLCTNCHNPHTQAEIQKDANGDPLPAEHQNIVGICEQCHSQIAAQYRTSVHGEALFSENNPDVPTCVQCHGIHNITQSQTVNYRLNSPELCASCHTDPAVMDQYGISTNVLNTYVDDFHGTTIMLFSETDPNRQSNKPVCYDCHGVHNIANVDDPERGIEIKQNMLVTCQKCHPDATQNFPASWMSHYIATPTTYPLVYYVNLFYKFFIPTVLGGMAIFVLSDVYRRARGLPGWIQTRQRRKPAPQAQKNTKEDRHD